MEKIKYDSSSMQLISMFERMTSAKLKDAFEIDNLQVFVVKPGFIGKAVGKKGANVKKLADMLKKNIKIIEYNPKIEVFAKNVTFPIIPAKIEYDQKEKVLTLIPKDLLSRGLLIGKQAVKLRETEKIIKRFFDVEEVKVAKPSDEVDESLLEKKENPAQKPITKTEETKTLEENEKNKETAEAAEETNEEETEETKQEEKLEEEQKEDEEKELEKELDEEVKEKIEDEEVKQ